MSNKKIKIALVCASGGHFEQLTNLSKFYDRYAHFWITNKNQQTINTLKSERKYFVNMAHFKRPWSYLQQLPVCERAFSEERPTHVLTTGSGRTALIPFILSKLRGLPFIHIDTFSRVYGYSKFGTFLTTLRHPFFKQWPDFRNSKVTYIGPVFDDDAKAPVTSKSDYIFVTVGTRDEPFTRLIAAVDKLKSKNQISERVIVQTGHTKYMSSNIETFDFCAPDRIDELVSNANYVITQESAGIGTKCLKYNTKFLVMPRDFRYRELPTRSDMNEDLHLKLEELGYVKVVYDIDTLGDAIQKIEELKTGFRFDNKLAINTLRQAVEES